MRRRAALVVAGLLAGATISMAGAGPAHAQVCYGSDPVFAYVCDLLNEEPGEILYVVYCTLSPYC